MKKVFALFLTLALILSCAGCSSKTAHTVDSFRSTMEAAGFEVTDITSSINISDGLEVTVLYAEKDGYDIRFYQFEDAEYAEGNYLNNCKILDEMDSKMRVSVSLPNYGKIEQTSSGVHYYMVWVDNTMLICENDSEYSQSVSEAVEMLGYN